MDEAEALCDRLVVINRGEVVAEGTPAALIDRFGGGVRVKFTLDGEDISWMSAVPHVTELTRERNRYEVRGAGPVLAHVAAALLDHALTPVDLRQERATLEEVFLELTSEREGAS
jgi:ABC-type multidrug transport system ATPase subunit